MKNILRLFFATFLIVTPAFAENINKSVFDENIKWSYRALAVVMHDMRGFCEKTNAKIFLPMGNLFRNNNAYLSVNQLADACRGSLGIAILDRGYVTPNGLKKECRLPNKKCDVVDGKITNCGEEKITGIPMCDIFLSTLMTEQNKEKAIWDKIKDKPGTYVRKHSTHKDVYQIYDVILAKNYWENDKINHTANTSEQNTKIYVIDQDGEITTLKNPYDNTDLHTWTNDMFFNIQVRQDDKRGGVRGAATHAVIAIKLSGKIVDETERVFTNYDMYRGHQKRDQLIMTVLDELPDGRFDFKNYAYRVPGQGYDVEKDGDLKTANLQHLNGAMLFGKIANYDWMGHFLYGMNKYALGIEPGTDADKLAEQTADGLSKKTSGGPEPLNTKEAVKLGYNKAQYIHNRMNRKYANSQTKYKNDAFTLARQTNPNLFVQCAGQCNPNPGTDDFVWCLTKNGDVQEFIFDDICD